MISQTQNPVTLTDSQRLQFLAGARRAIVQQNLDFFIGKYLILDKPLAFAPMHMEIMELAFQASTTRSQKIAIAGPRGHAKSTLITIGYVLWSICTGKEKHIMIISNTQEQAIKLLSNVKHELETNHVLQRDYPDVCPSAPQKQTVMKGKPWRDNAIVTGNDIRVAAAGCETKIRGALHKGSRPSLIILDDIENESDLRSEQQRINKLDWFERTVLKLGDPSTNVFILGNVLHQDSLMSKLVNAERSPEWISKVYKAIICDSDHPELWDQWSNIYFEREKFKEHSGKEAAQEFLIANEPAMLKGTEVVWPELWSFPQLMVKKYTENRLSFAAEMQNEPINSELCIFQETDFRYWDDQYGSIEELRDARKRNLTFFAAIDPSLGKRHHHGDYTAIVILARDFETNVFYVLETDIRRMQPNEIILSAIAWSKKYDFSQLGFETNQFQQVLAHQFREECRRQRLTVPVREITTVADKNARLQRLQPLMTSGQILFSKRHQMLLDQMIAFPGGKHDDGPDALEMAIDVADAFRVRAQFIGPKKRGGMGHDHWFPVDRLTG